MVLAMKIYLKLVLTTIFWGGTFIAGRHVAQNIGPFSIAFLRYAIASILLIVLTWNIEGKLPAPKKSQVIPIVLLGMTGVFAYNAMFFRALKIIEASRASLIIATCPIFIAISSALFLKEKFAPTKTFGVIISISGAIIVISKGNLLGIFQGGLGLGEFYIFCCVLSWTAYSLIGRTVMNDLSPLAAVSYSCVIGAAALAVGAYFEGVIQNIGHHSVTDWLSIGYLSIFGTVIGFVWYYEGIKQIGPTKAGLFINFVPIFAILLAFLILREAITISLLTGAVLVISGVYLTNRATEKR
jgi:drug/metabolite transporter (DMT)-like permease